LQRIIYAAAAAEITASLNIAEDESVFHLNSPHNNKKYKLNMIYNKVKKHGVYRL
jgi:hypothetical protein